MDILGVVSMPNWLIVLVLLLVAAYIYLTWTFNFWSSMGISGPRPWPVIGTLYKVISKGIVDSDMDDYRKYGKLVGHFTGRTPTLLVFDLDMLKQIIVKESHLFINHTGISGFDEYPFRSALTVIRDEHWKNVRTVLSPTFSGRKVRRMIDHINRCSENLVKHFTEKAKKNESFETKEYMGAFTMDVIAATAFGLELDSLSDRNNMFIQNARKIFDLNPLRPTVILFVVAPFLIPYMNKVGMYFVPRDVVSFFDNILEQTIEARAKQNMKETDFLQIMLNAQEGDAAANDDDDDAEDDADNKNDDDNGKNSTEDIKIKDAPKRKLEREEMIAQAFLFFLAGYETVNTAMGFLAYNLALNPECQEKLQHEIDTVMEGQEAPTYELIAQLTYLDMCLNESLRLHPPAPRTDRQSTDERDVIINGVRIPKGTSIGIPVMAIHYDPEHWPEPEMFDPERFTKEAKSKRHPMAWLPFGEGPRHCIGMRLALAEIKVAMVHILRKFSITTCEETQIPIVWDKKKSMIPVKPGIVLKLKERNQSTESEL